MTLEAHTAALQKDIAALEANLKQMRSALRALEQNAAPASQPVQNAPRRPPASRPRLLSRPTAAPLAVAVRDALLDILPRDSETAVQMRWMLKKLKSAHRVRVDRATIQRALRHLIMTGHVQRRGTARASCYWLSA